VRSPWG